MPQVASSLGATWDGAQSIYLMNGVNALGHTLAFSTVTRTWREAAPITQAEASNQAVLGRDGRIYTVGGSTPAGGSNLVNVFDPRTGAWRSAAPLPGGRANESLAAGADGRIYAFGGEDASGVPLLDAWAYDPSADQWTQLPPVPRPSDCRGDCAQRFDRTRALAAPDGKLYVMGHGWLPMDVFDPASGTWDTAPALPITGWFDFGAAVQPTTRALVAAGGLHGVDEIGSVWNYNVATRSWSAGPPLPDMQGVVALTADQSYVYAMGGFGQKPTSGNAGLTTWAEVAALGPWNGANTSVALGKSAVSRLGRISTGNAGELVNGVFVTGDSLSIYGTSLATRARVFQITGYHFFQNLGSSGTNALVLATWPTPSGVYDEGVVAIDVTKGTVTWQLPIPGPFCCYEENNASFYPVMFGHLFLFNSGTLYAVDAAAGTVLWDTALDAPYGISALVADANGVYVNHGESGVGHLVALDPATGAIRWTQSRVLNQQVPDGGSVQQLFADGTRIYAELSTDEVQALDESSGSVIWRVADPTAADRNLCAGLGELLTVTGGAVLVSGSGIYALDPTTGAPLWHYTVPCATTSGPAVDHGVVYTVVQRGTIPGLDWRSSPATLTELDAVSGRLLGEQPADANPGSTGGRVRVIGNDIFAGTIYGASQIGSSVTAPIINDVSTFAGTAATRVTITGQGLDQVKQVLIGGLPLQAPFALTPRSLTFTVPSTLRAGLITVLAPTGASLASTPWWSIPTIASVSPGWAPEGAPVTISGANLLGTTGVDFGGNAAGFTIQSDRTIVVTVPSGADGTLITVTAGPASATTTQPFAPPQPTITSINPSSGSVGTPITINGTSLAGASYVEFGGKTIASFTVNPDGSLATVVPAGAVTGTVYVCFTSGCTASPQPFTVN